MNAQHNEMKETHSKTSLEVKFQEIRRRLVDMVNNGLEGRLTFWGHATSMDERDPYSKTCHHRT